MDGKRLPEDIAKITYKMFLEMRYPGDFVADIKYLANIVQRRLRVKYGESYKKFMIDDWSMYLDDLDVTLRAQEIIRREEGIELSWEYVWGYAACFALEYLNIFISADLY